MENKAFTLLEVMAAVFILSIGLVGALGAISKAISLTSLSLARLEASYLAQEGIEITKNIRDTNWLEQRDNPGLAWDDGIVCCLAAPCDCQADFNDANLSSFENHYLKFDGQFYNYDSGRQTKFKRKITIFKDTDILKVSSQVIWSERGKDYQITAQENLYKWK